MQVFNRFECYCPLTQLTLEWHSEQWQMLMRKQAWPSHFSKKLKTFKKKQGDDKDLGNELKVKRRRRSLVRHVSKERKRSFLRLYEIRNLKKKKKCVSWHNRTWRAPQSSLDDRKLTVSIHVRKQVKLIYKGQSTPFKPIQEMYQGLKLLCWLISIFSRDVSQVGTRAFCLHAFLFVSSAENELETETLFSKKLQNSLFKV